MLKTSVLAAGLLALGGTLALAQTAPHGANGASPLRDVGSATANAGNTAVGGGRIASDYDTGPQQASTMGGNGDTDPDHVCVTDEYGTRYSCRGEPLGRAGR